MLPPQAFSVQNGKVMIDRELLARALADVEASHSTDFIPRTYDLAPGVPSTAYDLGPGVPLPPEDAA